MTLPLLPLAAATTVIAIASVRLIIVSWRQRAALSGFAGATAAGLLGLAGIRRLSGGTAVSAIVIGALILVILGSVLYKLGQFVERLLADDEGGPP